MRAALVSALSVVLLGSLPACTNCDFDGYEPMFVMLISSSPSQAVRALGGCAIYTDLSPEQQNPDAERPKLVHIGRGVYECLTGSAPHGDDAPAAYYEETLWFRIDGVCPWRGCISYECRTIDTNLSDIGAGCPAGMGAWDALCWEQFYAVIGHEVMHGYLGRYHG